MKIALSIAGSDSCAGAGIQADLKTFQALGVYGLTAITAVTAQNTCKIFDVQLIAPRIVSEQITCLFDDIAIDAVKIGMVASAALIETIAEALRSVERRPPVVLDPVMVSTSGRHLLAEDARNALVAQLFPLAEVVTPNIPEAAVLTGRPIENLSQMQHAAERIQAMGPANVVVKGGHLADMPATDILFDGSRHRQLTAQRIRTRDTHGTGCTFSSAIAAYLARGESFFAAAEKAKRFVSGAIEHGLDMGHGHGPTHHFFDLYARAGIAH